MGKRCVSLIDKFEFSKIVDAQIENRTEFLNSLPPDSKNKEDTLKLLDNLRKTKQFIDETEVCELDE